MRLALGFIVLSGASCAVASYNVTIPFVGKGEYQYDFDEYEARVVTSVENIATTYELRCPENTAIVCIGRGMSYTVVAGPSTYEFEFPDRFVYEHTQCQLTGSPFPTKGRCTELATRDILTYETTRLSTIDVPQTDDIFKYRTIVPGNLVVVGTVSATASNTGPRRTTTGSSSTRTGSITTSTTTMGSNEAAATSSIRSTNGAVKTGAPALIIAGALVGVVFGG